MQKTFTSFLAATFLLALAQSIQAGLPNAVYWDFGPTTASGTAVSNAFASLTTSTLTSGNSFGGYAGSAGNTLFNGTSASASYTTSAGFGNSAGTNAGVATSTIAFNTSTSAFFQVSFTLSSASAVSYTFTNVSFGSRATSTGPQTLSLYTSSDGSAYSSAASSISLANNSVWAAKEFSSLSLLMNPGDSLYFRIYGSGGTGNPGTGTVNWRIDDLAMAFTIAPVPEPSTMVLATIGGVVCLFTLRRRH